MREDERAADGVRVTTKGKSGPPITHCKTCNQAALRRHCPLPSVKDGSSTCDWVRCKNCGCIGLADGSHWIGKGTA
jgi:hypothetical protein